MLEDPFAGRAEKYDLWYETKGRAAFATELRALRAVLVGLPHPWLEVGVGTGRFAQELGIPFGVDPSLGLLTLARGRGVAVGNGRGEALPFQSGVFGAALLLTTWAFLPNPAAVLAEIKRVLRRGGSLVNAYLDREGAWGRSYVEKGRAGHPLFRRVCFATIEEVRTETERAGFSVTGVVSSLFRAPGDPALPEEPAAGYVRGASFVVVTARNGG